MLKTAVKNLFKNFRYAFMVMGIVYLAFIAGMFFFVKGLILICGDTINQVVTDLWTVISQHIQSFSLPTLTEIAEAKARLSETLNIYVGKVATISISLITLIIIVADIAKSMAVRYMRKDLVKPKISMTVITMVMHALFDVVFIALISVTFLFWHMHALWFVLLFLLTRSLWEMLIMKLTYLRGSPFKEVVSIKNAFKMFGIFFVVTIICLNIVVLVSVVFNIVIGVIILLPLYVYCMAVYESTLFLHFKEKQAMLASINAKNQPDNT